MDKLSEEIEIEEVGEGIFKARIKDVEGLEFTASSLEEVKNRVEKGLKRIIELELGRYAKFERGGFYRVFRDGFKIIQGLAIILIMVGAYLTQKKMSELEWAMKEPIIIPNIEVNYGRYELLITSKGQLTGDEVILKNCRINLIPYFWDEEKEESFPDEDKTIALCMDTSMGRKNLNAYIKKSKIDVSNVAFFEYSLTYKLPGFEELRETSGIILLGRELQGASGYI